MQSPKLLVDAETDTHLILLNISSFQGYDQEIAFELAFIAAERRAPRKSSDQGAALRLHEGELPRRAARCGCARPVHRARRQRMVVGFSDRGSVVPAVGHAQRPLQGSRVRPHAAADVLPPVVGRRGAQGRQSAYSRAAVQRRRGGDLDEHERIAEEARRQVRAARRQSARTVAARGPTSTASSRRRACTAGCICTTSTRCSCRT